MASENPASSVKLDPAAATAIIAQAEQSGMKSAAAGAAATPVTPPGVSPIDPATAAMSSKAVAEQSEWTALMSASTVKQATGGHNGVITLSQIEEQNAARLGEVGSEGTTPV
jgi:hypothetical protein